MALLVISSSDLRDCIGIEFLPSKVSCGDIRNTRNTLEDPRVSKKLKRNWIVFVFQIFTEGVKSKL